MRRKSRYNRHLYNAYDLDLKKSVVIFAEENGNKEAQARYGISEANIRRWRRLKNDIFGKPPHEYDRGKLRTRKRVNYNTKLEKSPCHSVEQDSQSSVGESTGSYSMPLQERLSKVAAQEKLAAGAAGPLKSQPLSPTKLKVTRQSPKVKHVEPPPSPVNEEMCLRWNSHHSNMQTAFPNILSKEQYVDVTLAAEGKTLKCHRLILSSCSPYFEEILSGISPFQHPVLFMRDIPFWILKSLCDFMYAGEVHVFQNKLEELLTVAEALKIKGLAGKSTPPDNQEEQKNENQKEKKKHSHDREKISHPPLPLKKNPVFTQSNNFESTSHDYDDDLLDPLDLLEPLYEEAAEEKKPPSTIVKPKENKYQYQPMKKPFTRRLRKRKYSEQREPSPPPVFSFRKGTRSRPNVKIPKYYHTDYTNPPKPATNAQTDPLLDVDEIKTEPIDVEDNLIDYSDEDHYLENSIDPVNCDSPIIITSAKPSLPQMDKFKKIKLTKPVITEVHTIEETNTTAGGLEVIKITLQAPEDLNGKKDEEKGEEPLQGLIITETTVVNEEPAQPEPEEELTQPEPQEELTQPEPPEELTQPDSQEELTQPDPQEELTQPDPQEELTQPEAQEELTQPEPPEEHNQVEPQEELTQPEPPQPEETESVVEIRPEEVIEQETGTEEVPNCAPMPEIRIEDVRTEGEQEDVTTTSLDHLEKEAMNVVNAINMETQATPPDIE